MALTTTQISQLYVAIFNRASEGEGNAYWAAQNKTAAQIADDMLNTTDAATYFGSSLDSNQAFIEHVYLNTLNKTVAQDPDGIAYWVSQLAGGASRGEVVASLVTAIDSYSPTGSNYDPTDLPTVRAYNQFANRVEVSNYMAETVSATPTDYATSTSFGHSLIVTDDASTVNSAKTSVVALVFEDDGNTIDFTPEMLNNLVLYRYDENDSENYISGFDGYLTGVFHSDGTVTIEKYKAPLGSSTWEMYTSYDKSWQIIDGKLIISGDDSAGDISQTTFTLLSQTQTEWSFLGETTGTNTMGTPETSDDINYTDEPSTSVWLIQEPLVARSSITIDDTTYIQGGYYTQGDGVSASGGVDYEVTITAQSASAQTMLGDLATSAFMINVFDTTSDQTITGSDANDIFNWRGGNDSFDGVGDGGAWYNGGCDAVTFNVSSANTAITYDTSVSDTLRIIGGSTKELAEIIKNDDGSVDITIVDWGNTQTLHVTNTELFRLNVVSQPDGEVFTAFNVDVDLTGRQTGTFDAVMTSGFTPEMLNNLVLYRYDEDESENYANGYDCYEKVIFHNNGAMSVERFKAPFGSSEWEMYDSLEAIWQHVDGQLIMSGDDEGDIWQSTFTLLSQTQTEWSILDETTGVDTKGTQDTSDDIPYTDDAYAKTWLLEQPLSARTIEAVFPSLRIVEVDTNGDSIADEIKYFNTDNHLVKKEYDDDFNGTFEGVNTYTYLEDGTIKAFKDSEKDGMINAEIIFSLDWVKLSEIRDYNKDGVYETYKEYTYLDNGNTVVQVDTGLYGGIYNGIFESKTIYETVEGSRPLAEYNDDDRNGVFDSADFYTYFENGNTMVQWDDGADGTINDQATYETDENSNMIEHYYDLELDGHFDGYEIFEYRDGGNTVIKIIDTDLDDVFDYVEIREKQEDGRVILYRDYDADGNVNQKYDSVDHVLVSYIDSDEDGIYDLYSTYDANGNAISGVSGDYGAVKTFDYAGLLI